MFYGCAFSRKIWKEVLLWLFKGVSSWSGELQWATQRFKGKNLNATILRIAWHAVVYLTWTERNNRIYNGKEGTMMQALEQIKEVIRIRLIGLNNVKLDSINFSLYRSWNLSHSIFE